MIIVSPAETSASGPFTIALNIAVYLFICCSSRCVCCNNLSCRSFNILKSCILSSCCRVFGSNPRKILSRGFNDNNAPFILLPKDGELPPRTCIALPDMDGVKFRRFVVNIPDCCSLAATAVWIICAFCPYFCSCVP